ncbi:hypothetical protein [Paenarthrobacter nitroguajacolicus]|uniref:hypothetical protein n=1 Tax=Paenarthrobacter nitroguajacolicus TaxID=211146 RepID=UPI00286BF54F|nr:hypothetical protein [Paenarthrobacter nitroguajacolicus]
MAKDRDGVADGIIYGRSLSVTHREYSSYIESMEVLWRQTPEYKRHKKKQQILFVCFLLLTMILIVGWIFLSTWFQYMNISPAFQITLLTTVIFAASAIYAALGPLEGAAQKRQFVNLRRLGIVENIQFEEQELAKDADAGNLDLADLWVANQRRIDYYHEIAMDQAKSSFRAGRWAMIGGFVTVILLGVAAALAVNGTASIAAGVIGVAGAAMGSYIGVTFMKAQAEASAQLRQFFLQPVEFSRMLGAERLLSTLEPSDRTAAVHRVIETMMVPTTAPTEAQKSKPEPRGKSNPPS